MAFPSSPIEAQLYTDEFGTVWQFTFDRWQRKTISTNNNTSYGTATGSSDITTASGYFYNNSSYFANGLTHVGNPDVVEEVEEGNPTLIKFTNTSAAESGSSDTSLTYDQSTGLINLTGVTSDMFILVRINCDIEPDSDESSAKLILECTANGASGGFVFGIEEQFLQMDQGANIDYEGLSSAPIFIGSTLADNGGTATIKPCIELKNTSGDVKPRTLAVYLWR